MSQTRASNQSWPEALQAGDLRGMWVALDNCRYDGSSKQPVEGDIVDSDEDLAELCARLQRSSRSKCTIVYCGDTTVIEPACPCGAQQEERRSA